MQIRIPELGKCLLLKPLLHYQQAVHNASSVFGTASFLGSPDNGVGDDWRVSLGYLIFFELARDNLFDLVFEAQGDFGHFFGRNWGAWVVFAPGGQHLKEFSEEVHTRQFGEKD